MKNSFRFALVSFLAAALMGCVENGPAEDSDAKDCDASIDGNTPTPDAGVDAPPTPVNHVPVVRITAPSPNTTFDVGSSVTITTDAVDNDIVGGGVAKVELYYTVGADSQQTWVGEATRLSGNIYQGTWQTVGLAAGSYKLYATAKGDKWHHEGDVDITGSLPVTLTLASPLTPSVNVTVSTNNLSAPGPVTVSWMTNNVNGCTANW
ncbi:MAG: hypothetical protein KBC69_00305, partial [Candidatus Magasanikbacteria bacterium]|nr:hypothetical protein [Candidatus Magasanikbacteria bacterium]